MGIDFDRRIDVRECARCCGDHFGLPAFKLVGELIGCEPNDRPTIAPNSKPNRWLSYFTHYALCPENGQPIMVSIESGTPTAAKPKGTRSWIVSTDILTEVAKGFVDGVTPRSFQVVEGALPADAAIIGVQVYREGASIEILLESAEWDGFGGRVDPQIRSADVRPGATTSLASAVDKVAFDRRRIAQLCGEIIATVALNINRGMLTPTFGEASDNAGKPSAACRDNMLALIDGWKRKLAEMDVE